MQDTPAVDGSDDNRASYLRSSPERREDVREAVRQGSFHELRGSAASIVRVITYLYCNAGQPFEQFEPLLRDLWYLYYQGGSNISYESAEQDKLAFDLLAIRGLGPLTNPVQSKIAQTPVMVLWQDLPYFAVDMTDFWANDCATMDANQRLNFSRFLARIASTGLDSDKLCQVALLLFRDTLETARPLGSLNEHADANPDRTRHDLSIAALLPSLCIWAKEAGRKLILLSDMSWNDCSDNIIGEKGALFTESGLGQKSSAGFSPWRLLYWMKRLDEIIEEATQAGEKTIADYAMDALDFIVNHIDDRDNKVLKEYQAAGNDFDRLKGRFTAEAIFARMESWE